MAWPGFIGLPPTWQATWAYHYGNVNTINVNRATLGYVNGNAFIFPVDILKDAPVCSDTRGYWGDYDAMIQNPGEFSQTKAQKRVYDWSQAMPKVGSPATNAGASLSQVTADFTGAARKNGSRDLGALGQR